jgi:hypothetical protein
MYKSKKKQPVNAKKTEKKTKPTDSRGGFVLRYNIASDLGLDCYNKSNRVLCS